MNDEVDSFTIAHADFEESRREVGAEQHGEVVEEQYAKRLLFRLGITLIPCRDGNDTEAL